jgi:hypothetical protein
MSALARKAAVGKLNPATTYFLLCDIQERFRDVIFHFPQVCAVRVGGLRRAGTIASASSCLSLKPWRKDLDSSPKSIYQSIDPINQQVMDGTNRLPPPIHQIVRTAKLMTGVGKHLEIPTLATEQYPKAFGPTVRLHHVVDVG